MFGVVLPIGSIVRPSEMINAHILHELLLTFDCAKYHVIVKLLNSFCLACHVVIADFVCKLLTPIPTAWLLLMNEWQLFASPHITFFLSQVLVLAS